MYNLLVNIGQYLTEKKSLFKVREILFYQQLLRIPWTGHMRNEDILMKIGITKQLLLTSRKKSAEISVEPNGRRGLGEFNTLGNFGSKIINEK